MHVMTVSARVRRAPLPRDFEALAPSGASKFPWPRWARGTSRNVRLSRLAWLLVSLGSVGTVVAACNSRSCSGAICGCYDGDLCIQACGPEPCELDCASFRTSCRSSCGDDCVTGCHDGPSCRSTCG